MLLYSCLQKMITHKSPSSTIKSWNCATDKDVMELGLEDMKLENKVSLQACIIKE